MDHKQKGEQTHVCPMDPEARQPNSGNCPDLFPEGTRFAMLRHMIKSPLVVIIMVAVMGAIMAAIMMMR